MRSTVLIAEGRSGHGAPVAGSPPTLAHPSAWSGALVTFHSGYGREWKARARPIGGPMAVYLDHAATTPMSDAAISAYVDAMAVVGNPSSIHSQGQNARRLLEEAREEVAATLGCDPI